MAKVNDDGRYHASFIETYPGTPFPDVRFWPYDGGATRKTLTQAMNIIEKNVYKKSSACNSYFSHLSKGRKFDDIWSDPTFFINWDPRISVKFWAFMATTRPMEITISQETFTKGAWFTAAMMIHEMAHLGGAPGIDGSGSNAAEKALKSCGFSAFFDAARIGINSDYANVRLKEMYA
jgi:hypothetical protein